MEATVLQQCWGLREARWAEWLCCPPEPLSRARVCVRVHVRVYLGLPVGFNVRSRVVNTGKGPGSWRRRTAWDLHAE